MRTSRRAMMTMLMVVSALSACARPARPTGSPAPSPAVSMAPTPGTTALAVPGPGEIVYICDTQEVCVVGGDGSDPRPTWMGGVIGISADGQQEARAYTSYEYSSDGHLSIGPSSRLADKTVWRFIGLPSGSPAWSPDGRRIAVTIRPPDTAGYHTPSGLWVLDADGRHVHRVAANAFGMVAWDASGTRLAFVVRNGPNRSDRRSIRWRDHR